VADKGPPCITVTKTWARAAQFLPVGIKGKKSLRDAAATILKQI
jgi:hypothetical protein